MALKDAESFDDSMPLASMCNGVADTATVASKLRTLIDEQLAQQQLSVIVRPVR